MKIQNKLFLFLFSFSLILVTVLVLLMQWSIGKGMVDYVLSKEIATLKPVISKLSDIYKAKNNWHTMVDNHPEFIQLISQQLEGSDFEVAQRTPPPKSKRLHKNNNFTPESTAGRPPQTKGADNKPPPHNSGKMNRPPHTKGGVGRPPRPIEIDAHYALLDLDGKLIVGSYRKNLTYVKTPIEANNTIVGYFAIAKRNQVTQGYEVDFLEQQQYYLWLIALFVMVLVALVTFPLARHIVEPIKLITRGMHKLTQGDYQQSIKLNRQDELYELSRDYNELALTLAENEAARKRWLADISHELRTPVAILRGELEAMLDKVRPLTASNISSANDEVKHLQRLIDDLNILTSTDVGGMRYRKQHQNLITLMQNEAEKYRGYLADAGISLILDVKIPIANIYADKSRLVQLYENIISNCIKYSSATQLKISVTLDELKQKSAEKSEPCVMITFEDDGIGVDEKHLMHLFEHLYRVENSRNRKTGGSGLGLSICRHIVVAHQGEIIAQKARLGGLAIIVSLPISAIT
ncbi:MAG: ATP-binding protein [Colwellia sp.]